MSQGDPGARTRNFLVEDQADFRPLMTKLLNRQPGLEVVAQAGSLSEARCHALTVSFDVAVLDLGLPDGNGMDVVEELRGPDTQAAVVILSASLDPGNLEKAMDVGVDGVLDKLSSPDEIIATIRRLGDA